MSIRPTIRSLAAGSALAIAAAALPAHAVTLIGLTTTNKLVSFDSANPLFGSAEIAVAGLAGDERLLGIDLRPSTGVLYGFSSTGNLYTIDARHRCRQLRGDGLDGARRHVVRDRLQPRPGQHQRPVRIRCASSPTRGQNLRVQVNPSGGTSAPGNAIVDARAQRRDDPSRRRRLQQQRPRSGDRHDAVRHRFRRPTALYSFLNPNAGSTQTRRRRSAARPSTSPPCSASTSPGQHRLRRARPRRHRRRQDRHLLDRSRHRRGHAAGHLRNRRPQRRRVAAPGPHRRGDPRAGDLRVDARRVSARSAPSPAASVGAAPDDLVRTRAPAQRGRSRRGRAAPSRGSGRCLQSRHARSDQSAGRALGHGAARPSRQSRDRCRAGGGRAAAPARRADDADRADRLADAAARASGRSRFASRRPGWSNGCPRRRRCRPIFASPSTPRIRRWR